MLKEIFNYFFKRKNTNKLNKVENYKINFIFKMLIHFYEQKINRGVDFPPFYYAICDVEKILKQNKIEEVYKEISTHYKKLLTLRKIKSAQ